MSGSTSADWEGRVRMAWKFDKRAWAARFVRMQGFGCQPGANTKLVARFAQQKLVLWRLFFFMLVESHINDNWFFISISLAEALVRYQSLVQHNGALQHTMAVAKTAGNEASLVLGNRVQFWVVRNALVHFFNMILFKPQDRFLLSQVPPGDMFRQVLNRMSKANHSAEEGQWVPCCLFFWCYNLSWGYFGACCIWDSLFHLGGLPNSLAALQNLRAKQSFAS